MPEETKTADAGEKTLAAWLEELEKDKMDRLQKVIDQRMNQYRETTNNRKQCSKSISRTTNINHSMLSQCIAKG